MKINYNDNSYFEIKFIEDKLNIVIAATNPSNSKSFTVNSVNLNKEQIEELLLFLKSKEK